MITQGTTGKVAVPHVMQFMLMIDHGLVQGRLGNLGMKASHKALTPLFQNQKGGTRLNMSSLEVSLQVSA